MAWGLAVLAFVSVLVVLVRRQQYRLLYLPNFGPKGPLFTPGDMGLQNWKKVEIPVNEKSYVLAYFLMYPAKGRAMDPNLYKRTPTLIFFHGNAGNIGHRVPQAVDWQGHLRCNVMLVAYRGYDGSTDQPPSETGMVEDAVAALRYLDKEGMDTEKVFVLGTSLGGAVTLATAHAAPYRLRGICIENSFTSIKDMTHVLLERFVREGSAFLQRERARVAGSAPKRMAYSAALTGVAALPAVWTVISPVFLSLRWESLHRARTLPADMNTLFLSGARDELIPVRHMTELYGACSARKKFVSFPNGTHNDTFLDKRWIEEVARWMDACLKGVEY